MKPRSSTLQHKAKHGYDVLLFNEFRALPKRLEAARLEEFLTLLIEANRLRELVGKNVPTESKDAFLSAMEDRARAHSAYNSTIQTLNKLLSKYKWVSVLTGDLDSLREALENDGKVRAGYSTWENAMVRFLLDKLRVPGELARFRHCSDCQNWFFAITAHQRFCGDACRRRHTANSTEFKEKRRLYMQQTYRPQQKQRDIESRALAKRVAVAKERGGR